MRSLDKLDEFLDGLGQVQQHPVTNLLAEVKAVAVDVRADVAAIQGSVGSAKEDAQLAEDSRVKAAAARDAAQGHRTAAGNSATAAAGSAAGAGTAKADAEKARDSSVAARNGSEAARDLTLGYRDASLLARDATIAARDLATTRAAEAVAAQAAAKGSSDVAAALAAAFQIDPDARLVAPPTKDIRFLPDVTPGVNIDRATIGYRTNRFGLLEPIAANGPRHDFDPITGAYLGAMVGPSRANVLTWSEDFSNSVWTKWRASVTPDAAIAPDGSMTADKIVEDSQNGSHYLSRAVVVTPEVANTVSFYARAGERSIVNIQASGGLIDGFHASINLLTGALSGTAASRVRLKRLPNGWWRIAITFTPAAGTTSTTFSIVSLIDASGSISHQGDGVSGLYLWGSQCEVGSAETCYIKTEGASVSRAADGISAPITSDVINPGEATFFWEGIMGPSLGGTAEESFFSLDDGTMNNYLMVYRNNARRVGAVVVSQNPATNVVYSVAYAAWGANPAPILNDHALARVALTTNRQVSRLAVNGASVEIPHRAGSMWTLSRLVNLRLGHRVSTGTHMPGHQRRFIATPRYLTAAEIEALTRI